MRNSKISFINDTKTMFSFSGCIGRLEFFILAVTIDVIYISLFYIAFDYFGSIQKDVIENGINSTTILLGIIALVLGVIKFAAITKRIHDIGKKGAWAFAACIASRNLLINIVLLGIYFKVFNIFVNFCLNFFPEVEFFLGDSLV